MRALGAVLVVLGVALALRSALLLAGRGRPRRGPRPALVIAGPYRRMRNPLLAGALVVALGASLSGGSAAFVAGVALVALATHLFVVRVEEPRLERRFGDAYRAYLRCVPRWVPRFTRAGDDRRV